ncbi:MAG: hypothetical protein HQ564_00875 [Candidatus Saganbacteria bacterium]|nr:hypothetical protein [Candidatus Saganbacteria bacterium]
MLKQKLISFKVDRIPDYQDAIKNTLKQNTSSPDRLREIGIPIATVLIDRAIKRGNVEELLKNFLPYGEVDPRDFTQILLYFSENLAGVIGIKLPIFRTTEFSIESADFSTPVSGAKFFSLKINVHQNYANLPKHVLNDLIADQLLEVLLGDLKNSVKTDRNVFNENNQLIIELTISRKTIEA